MSTHSKCLAFTKVGDTTYICARSPGHVKSEDPERRKHFDPDDGGFSWLDEKQARKEYLAKLNSVLSLGVRYLNREWSYQTHRIGEITKDLVALGVVTNLQQTKLMERLGWELVDHGMYGDWETVGHAVVRVSEHYFSRFQIGDRELAEADEQITELQRLVDEIEKRSQD